MFDALACFICSVCFLFCLRVFADAEPSDLLFQLSSETGLVPRIMCTSRRPEVKECHPWHFLLHYYNYKVSFFFQPDGFLNGLLLDRLSEREMLTWTIVIDVLIDRSTFISSTLPMYMYYSVTVITNSLALFYQQNGNQFNKSATKKLSDSFQLTSVGHTTITPQQTLLSTIGEIIEAHAKFDRSPMTHLKALVCAGLK